MGNPPQGRSTNTANQAPQMVELDFASAAIALNITEEELKEAFSSTTQGPPDFEAIAEKLGVSLEDLLAAFGIDNIQMQGPGPGQGPGPRN